MVLAELLCSAVIAIGMPNAHVACLNMSTLVESAEQNQIDPVVFVALIHVESRWTPKARSRDNACGLTQVLPRYSSGYGGKFGKRLSCRQLFDPATSIKRGARIFGYWFHKYGKKRYKVALCGYNKGYRCKGRDVSSSGMRYARNVLRLSKKLKRKLQIIKKTEYEDVPGCYE